MEMRGIADIGETRVESFDSVTTIGHSRSELHCKNGSFDPTVQAIGDHYHSATDLVNIALAGDRNASNHGQHDGNKLQVTRFATSAANSTAQPTRTDG